MSNHVLTLDQIRNDGEAESNGLVLAAIGDHFESALAAVVYHSRNVVLAAKKADGALDDELKALKDDVKIEWMENWYDGLGYCKYISELLSSKTILTESRHLERPGAESDGREGVQSR